MLKLNCAPKNKQVLKQNDDYNDFSCFPNSVILQLKKLWNKRHPDVPITSVRLKTIYKHLKENLNSTCDKELCWINRNINSEFKNLNMNLSQYFAPKKPLNWSKNPNQWLSSLDIMAVMKQYERNFKCFNFIGPTPIDFDKTLMDEKCVWEEMCSFSIKEQLEKGKTKIGIIFNTDPHTKGGEHWISLFIDLNKKIIFYFDSVGNKIPHEVSAFVSRVINQGLTYDPKIIFKYDDTENISHQQENTECGVYALYFITKMLRNKVTAKTLKNKRLTDKYISKYRNFYFNG